MAKFSELIKLIKDRKHEDEDFINLGDSKCEIVPTEDRIKETEEILGINLPKSYLWFLKNYGGGEIYGEEIYYISLKFSDIPSGDIAQRTLMARKEKWIKGTEVLICYSHFGEIFLMDSAQSDIEGEYPVYIQLGEDRRKYADSFLDFIFKRINNPEG